MTLSPAAIALAERTAEAVRSEASLLSAASVLSDAPSPVAPACPDCGHAVINVGYPSADLNECDACGERYRTAHGAAIHVSPCYGCSRHIDVVELSDFNGRQHCGDCREEGERAAARNRREIAEESYWESAYEAARDMRMGGGA